MDFRPEIMELRFATKESAMQFRDKINKPPFRLTGKAKARPTLPTRHGTSTCKSIYHVFSVWFTGFALADTMEIQQAFNKTKGATKTDRRTSGVLVVK